MKYKLQRLWERFIGMRLALWIDKRHPEYCWAEVCTSLGLGWNICGWREDAQRIESCREDCARNGSCWCGKLMTPQMREEFKSAGGR